MAGDDLEDGLEYEFDSSASDNELPTEKELLEGIDSDSDVEEPVKRQKPQLEGQEEPAGKDNDEPKQIKRKKKDDKIAEKKKQKTEAMAKQKTQVALYTKDMLADFMANKLRAKNSDLSALEIDDMSVSKDQISELKFSPQHTDDNIVKFVEKFLPTLEKEKFVMVVCMSAIRACDVMRLLRPIQGGCLKLIKKNKLQYDKKALSVGKTFLATSTAGRLKKLSDESTLDLSRVGAFIIDSSYLDGKSHSIWDLDDVIPTLKHLADKSGAQIYMY